MRVHRPRISLLIDIVFSFLILERYIAFIFSFCNYTNTHRSVKTDIKASMSIAIDLLTFRNVLDINYGRDASALVILGRFAAVRCGIPLRYNLLLAISGVCAHCVSNFAFLKF